MAFLVKRIGGPHVRVEALVQPGQDPHTFEPTPRQVVRLSNARLFFKVGMPFEEVLTEHIAAANERTAIVDTAAGIKRLKGVDPDEQGEPDPHVSARASAARADGCEHRRGALCGRSGDARDFHANQAALDAELDALDRRLGESLKPFRGQAFYVFHPAFGYFADAYHLRQESVEVEGKPPTPRQLVDLIRRARADQVKIIFLQPQFNQQAAASIAQALGGAAMPMDSLAYDVLKNLGEVAKKIAAANDDARTTDETRY